MSWNEKIMDYVNKHPGATDREMRTSFKTTNQTINTTCRNLANKGLLVRINNPEKGGLIGNYPTGKEPQVKPTISKRALEDDSLQEEDIKHILTEKLVSEGWNVKTAWGNTPGVDIEAKRGEERWLIEIKGPGSRNEMRNNYFIGILGEMLQRMDDPVARYSICFPDIEKYRRLWNELPSLAKKRTTIDILFVDKDGRIENLK